MIAIITARGGSKGLPKKNLMLLNGIPLIAHTILAALKSNLVSRVIVNTDDIKIAEISKEFGAEVPFLRPKSLAEDNSSTFDVLIHNVNWFKTNEDLVVDSFVLLQPTSPFRKSRHIDEAISLFIEKDADSVVSCVKNRHPIFWSKYVNPDGCFDDVFQDIPSMRQNYRDTFIPNGAIYVTNSKLLYSKTMFSNKTYSYIMEDEDSIDIDTITDFEYAQFLINRKNA